MEVNSPSETQISSRHSLKHKHAGCESCAKGTLKSTSKLTPRSIEPDKPRLKSHKDLTESMTHFKHVDTENVPPVQFKPSKLTSECPSCKKQISEDKLKLHIKSCISKRERIPKKLTDRTRPKQKENILETKNVEQTQITQILPVVCSKCNQNFTSETIQQHLTECQTKENLEEKKDKLPKTIEIKEMKPFKEIINKPEKIIQLEKKDNLPKTVEIKEKKPLKEIIDKPEKIIQLEKKECPYCKNVFDTDMYNTHLTTCKELPTDQTLSKIDFSTQTTKPKVLHFKETPDIQSPDLTKLQKKPSFDRALKQEQLQKSFRQNPPASIPQPPDTERKKRPDKTVDLIPQELINKVKTAFFRTSKFPKEDEKTKHNALSQSMIVPRLQYCHMCGEKYIPKAQFCAYCGIKKYS